MLDYTLAMQCSEENVYYLPPAELYIMFEMKIIDIIMNILKSEDIFSPRS